jgi:hypothetical protein
MTTPMGKSGHGAKTSRKVERAIAALLSHGTLGQAAVASDISESTLRRWLKEPHFQAAYGQAKRQLLEGTINRLRSIGDDAVDGLSEVVKDKNSPAGARVSAGRAILEIMLKAVEAQDLADRLDKLEEAMGKDE